MLPTAAVPALAGMAASVCLAPQALADPTSAHSAHSAHSAVQPAAATQPAAAPQPAVVADAGGYAGMAPAELLAAVRQATRPVSYTVHAGDSLSSIAGRFYHQTSAWPVLYWANHNKIRWANVLGTGLILKIPAAPAKIPAAPGQAGPAASPGSGSGPGYAPVQATAAVAGSYSGGTPGGTPGGSFGQCVIARESGGNAQIMNGSGHYGLYQFSESTWVAYGGSAADFGHASAAEQNRVFANALAQGGQSNWAPYDGC